MSNSISSNYSQTVGDPPLEVSYMVFKSNENQGIDALQTIATAINVRLILNGQDSIPFIAPTNFHLACKQDRLFLYGVGGSGKSRIIFELVKSMLQDVDRNRGRIFVINPIQSLDREIKKTTLMELAREISSCDVVVWDNFPDGLFRKDIDTGKRALEMVTYSSTKNLYIALKPKFLEIYRGITDSIPDFYAYHISYDIEKIKEIIKLYGVRISPFKKLYENHVTTNITAIARILWQKEPIPMTILNYYQDLANKKQSVKEKENDNKLVLLDAITLANNILPRTDYYEHQFEHLINSESRQVDAEFLYTLKLCYELGVDRKVNLVKHLQSEIFKHAPSKDIIRKLGGWLYLSGQYLSMHDVPREAIKFNNETTIKIINHLTHDFSNVVTSQREDQPYAAGAFFGRNIQLLLQQGDENSEDKGDHFLPKTIYKYMKSQRKFEIALGQGAGEVFSSLDQQMQERILNRIGIDGEFARGLGESLGRSFETLDQNIQRQIISETISKSILFARGLGESMGRNFGKLAESLQEEIIQIIREEKNYNFPRGLGEGLGRVWMDLEPNVQENIVALAIRHIPLAIGVGYGLGLNFTSSLAKEFQDQILVLSTHNGELTRGLGMGLGQNFPFLTKELQHKVLKWTDKDTRLDFGLGYQLGFSFTYLTEELQKFVLDRIKKKSEFAWGSGWGFGVVYTYLQREIQKQLLDLTTKSIQFAIGLGSGMGFHLQYLATDLEEELFTIIENNKGLTTGVAFGCGYSFPYLREDLQLKVWRLMRSNYRFAIGLGWGFGFTFSYLPETIQNEVLKNVKTEHAFALGLGRGLGFTFTYLSTQFRQKADLLAQENRNFAFGLGIGLGNLYSYLTAELQQDVWMRAMTNVQFAIGLGSEFGYLFPYMSPEFQQMVLSKSQSNAEIARGMGWGLGHTFVYLSENMQQDIIRIANKNPQLMVGLGWGLGHTIAYLPVEMQENTVRMASTDLQFAIGLGEGLARGFSYPQDFLSKKTFEFCDKNNGIARGAGFGFGNILNYLPAELQQDVWMRAMTNVQFAIGLGEGLGQIIQFLSLDLQNEIFAKIEQNNHLARGLGSGIGYTHLHLADNMPNKVLGYVNKNSEFGRGYGEGIGRIFYYWTPSLLNYVLSENTGESNTQFAIGLGEGIGQLLPYGVWKSLINNNNNTIHKSTQNNSRHIEKLFAIDAFSYGLGFGLASILQFLQEEDRTSIFQGIMEKRRNFALGKAVGYFFASLKPDLQEKMLHLSENDTQFAHGLSKGIGFTFRYLDPIVQQGLLTIAENDTQFAHGLGQGTGISFPSLNQELQEEILKFAEMNNEFLKGFGQGIDQSFGYLEEGLRTRIATLVKTSDACPDRISVQQQMKSLHEFIYDDFATLRNAEVITIYEKEEWLQDTTTDMNETEVLFSGRTEKYCVCYIDMMNSTNITSSLNDTQLSKYYAIFLNSMATIAKNFGARIIKNAGDCLIYYFPSTANVNNSGSLRNVLECCTTMIYAHRAINALLNQQRLPPLHYRISADYGKVEVARSSSSKGDDLFGSTMNVCAKINSKAPANGMVIGNNLHQVLYPLIGNDYNFERIGAYTGLKEEYPIYSVTSTHKRNILNPFKRTTESDL